MGDTQSLCIDEEIIYLVFKLKNNNVIKKYKIIITYFNTVRKLHPE